MSSKASVARHDAQYHMLALLGATPLEIAGSFSPLQGIEDATSARSATSATRSW
ncbi:MAG TPA: hypothetical protein VGX23_18510 [Actinocrinis sp.]|nr:hypothetical protein [Actinocrinis sp.]